MGKREYANYEWDSQLLKPKLIGFYNLHLQSGPEYDREFTIHEYFNYTRTPYPETTVIKTPDEDEQAKITAYFEEYHHSANTPLESKKKKGDNWYEEEGCSRFLDDYHYTKIFLDQYIEARSKGSLLLIHEDSIKWLVSRLGVREPVPRIKAESVRFDWDLRITDKERFYYGPEDIYQFMSCIFEALKRMCEDQWRVGKCALEECNNIIVRGSGRRQKQYCTNAHRLRHYRRRKAQEKT